MDRTKREEGTLIDGIQTIQKSIISRKQNEVPELVAIPRKAQASRRRGL